MQQMLLGGAVNIGSCDSADFDGTNDYMTRGATLTGIGDGKQGTVSLWVRLDGGDGSLMRIIRNATTVAGATSRFSVLRLPISNVFGAAASNAAGTTILSIATSGAYTASATWLHVLISWDLATAGARFIYINDAADLAVTAFTNDTIDYTVADWAIGATADGTEKLDGCLAELWFTTTFIDISVEANRRKFLTAGLKPVFLGATGELPTGTAPLVYQRVTAGAAASTFATNLGTGGNFSITGTLTTGSTSPSQ